MAKCAKSWESIVKCAKSWESLQKGAKVCKSKQKCAKVCKKNADKVAEKAATEQIATNVPSSYSNTNLGQASNDPATHLNSLLFGVSNTEAVPSSYFGMSAMSHSSISSVSSEQLMQQNSQNAAQQHMLKTHKWLWLYEPVWASYTYYTWST